MIQNKYFLIYSDDEDISYYLDDNSIEGYLTIEGEHVLFESDDYVLDVNGDVEENDDEIIVNTGLNYYTFSIVDIENVEKIQEYKENE